MESSHTSGMIYCEECGRLIDEESHFCQYCGHEKPGEEKKKEEERRLAAKEKTLLPVLGGILIILSAFFVFVTIWLVHDIQSAEPSWWPFGLIKWPDWFLAMLAIFGIVGIAGGVSAMLRKSREAALIGGVLSSIGVGAVIGVIGLLLVAASEEEFMSRVSDYTELSETIDERTLGKPEFGWRR